MSYATLWNGDKGEQALSIYVLLMSYLWVNDCVEWVSENIWGVLVTFPVAVTKYLIPNLKGGRIYFRSQFIEVQVPSWLAPRQDGTEEVHGRGEIVHGRVSRKQRARLHSVPLYFIQGTSLLIGAIQMEDGASLFGKSIGPYPKLC